MTGGRPEPVVLASGLESPEAPLQMPDGTWLVVEMSEERGCVTSIDADGSRLEVARTGRPNGLALTPDGIVLVAESKQRSLLALTGEWSDLSGEWETLAADDGRGGKMLFPNDLCVGADAAIYMTDSGLTLEVMQQRLMSDPDPSSLPFDGRLYRIDLESGSVETLDDGQGHLNGISLGPDLALYTNETISGDVYRYGPTGGGRPGTRQRFGNVLDGPGRGSLRGPDGMAHDVEGNLWVTVFNEGEVAVIDPGGSVVDRIDVHGLMPTNLAFGRGEEAIYVTEREHGTLQRIEVGVRGVALSEFTGLSGDAPDDYAT